MQDFGKQHTKGGKAVILVIILFFKVDGLLVWRYFDFFDTELKGKSDYEFVEASWLSLFEMGALSACSSLHVWSDGGCGDFYNSSCLHFFSSLQSLFKLKTEVSFFVEYHGHSRCDGHIGTGKRKVRKMANLFQQSFSNEFVYSVFSSLKNTEGCPLNIAHGKSPRTKTLQGIKSFKHFKFPSVGVVDCYLNTSSKICEQTVNLHFKEILSLTEFEISMRVVGKLVDVMFEKGDYYCGSVMKLCKRQVWVKFCDGTENQRLLCRESQIRVCLHKPQLTKVSH